MKTHNSFATTTSPNTVAGRFRIACAARLLLLLMLPVVGQAQFNYTINNDNTITITKYTGSGGAVTIPSVINGLPVTSIGESAFFDCASLASVTIPNSVTNIGDGASYQCTSPTFDNCTSLSAINVEANNPDYSSVDGVLFNQNQTTLIQYPGGKAGAYTIPNTVTSIGGEAFDQCYSLTNVTIGNRVTSIEPGTFNECVSLTSVTIPNSVISIGYAAFNVCYSLTNVTIGNSVTIIGFMAFSGTSLTSVTIPNSVTIIEDSAFDQCYNLTNVYFKGNAPLPFNGYPFTEFLNNNLTVYYLPGTTGWDTFSYDYYYDYYDFQIVPWYLPNPVILDFEPNFGVQTNGFGFMISWATNISVVVEACTNFANPVWQSVQTNTLTGGSCYFSDPAWANYPSRFYRLRSP